jgi:hypothetical protein
MLFEEIIKKLNDNNVRYLVVGGVAANLHGYQRSTGDLDIVLALDDGNLKLFALVVEDLKLQPRLPVCLKDFADKDKRDSWINEKNMKAFALYNPKNWIEHLDVVIDYPVDFESAYENRNTIKDGSLEAPVICIEDLIKMKEYANRERDKIDLAVLRKIKQFKDESR